MKIGIVTIHHANSYGGVLQAYASKKFFSSYGEVNIIDYKSHHISNTMKLVRLGDGPRSILRAAKDISRIYPRSRLLNKFNEFCFNNLDVGQAYSKIDDSNKYDVAVTGSDQIWNPRVTDGLDENYFLRNVIAKKKISFSTSFGSHRYSREDEERVREYLSVFSDLAVREDDSAKYLSNLIGRPVTRTVDPTLLLNKDEWSNVMASNYSLKGPYILVYSLKEDSLLSKVVSYYAQKLKIKVVAISQNPFCSYKTDLLINDAGPSEYLRLFSDASFVITNSFHGTAFSCNFSKAFVTVKPEHGENRIKTLLNDVGLADRMIESYDQISESIISAPDWSSVGNKINELKKKARDFVEGAL